MKLKILNLIVLFRKLYKENAKDRSEFGRWEGDLVTGPRDDENGAFLTLIERKTRFYYMIPIKNKKSKSVYMAINKLNKLYGDDFRKIFKSITFDTRSKFTRFKDIEKSQELKYIELRYFCTSICIIRACFQ